MPRITYAARLERFERLLGEAKARGDADRALVSLLTGGAFDSLSRKQVVAALGNTTGPAGSAALRGEFAAARDQLETATSHSRAEYRDLMCACVWALGKRDGPGGTDIFTEAAAHASADVRGYGLAALAAVGDDRAWEDMLAALRGRLAKKSPSARRGGDALKLIGYLARHCERNADRQARLAGLLRDRWSNVPDAQTVADRYPGAGPGGPPPTEIDFVTFIPPAPWKPPPRARADWERQSSLDAFQITHDS